MSESRKVEFMPPKDVAMPEGLQPGDDFDMVCTFKITDSGVCLTKMGDAQMAGYDSRENEHKPDYSEYAESLRQPDAGDSGQQPV